MADERYTVAADETPVAAVTLGDHESALARGRAAFAAGDWHAATDFFRGLVDSPKYGAEANYGLGMIALAQGRTVEAEALFVSSLTRDKRHANALYQLAKLKQPTAPQQAAAMFAGVLTINPNHVSAFQHLAELRSAAARPEVSRQSDPGKSPILAEPDPGRTPVLTKSPDEASRELRPPEPAGVAAADACYDRGMVALAGGRAEEAQSCFGAALEQDPLHANSLYQLAKLREPTAPDEAAAMYGRVLGINAFHVSALKRLSDLRNTNSHVEGSSREHVLDGDRAHAETDHRCGPQAPRPAGDAPSSDADLSGPGHAVERFLRQDPSPQSREAVELIDKLRLTVNGLAFSAQLDRLIAPALRLIGAAFLVAGGVRAGEILLFAPPFASSYWSAAVGLALMFAAWVLESANWHGRYSADTPSGKSEPPAGRPRKPAARMAFGLAVLVGAGAVGVGLLLRNQSPPYEFPTLLTDSLICAVVLWAAFVAYRYLWARRTTIEIANGRLYSKTGILATSTKPYELWLVQGVGVYQSFLNKLTNDGTLIIRLVGRKEVAIPGLRKESELYDLSKELDDLRTLLRANPMVKGIVQE
jgi:tetratricopeptide (TPR) repeat protein